VNRMSIYFAVAPPGYELYHFGIKGMKWGVRKKRETFSERAKKRQDRYYHASSKYFNDTIANRTYGGKNSNYVIPAVYPVRNRGRGNTVYVLPYKYKGETRYKPAGQRSLLQYVKDERAIHKMMRSM